MRWNNNGRAEIGHLISLAVARHLSTAGGGLGERSAWMVRVGSDALVAPPFFAAAFSRRLDLPRQANIHL